MTLEEIRDYLNTIFSGVEILGNKDLKIHGLAKIEEAGPGHIAFIANPKYEKFLETTNASAVIVPKKLSVEGFSDRLSFVRVDDAYTAFVFLLEKLSPPRTLIPKGVAASASVASSAKLHESVSVGENAYIGQNCTVGENTVIGPNVVLLDGVRVGQNCRIYPNVTLYDGTRVGDRVIIHSGTTVGADGFGFAPQPDGSYKKIPQTGIVVLEDDVELGANMCIDRATLGETVIRQGVKIDNLVQIAHNCIIGTNTVIASQAGISGSTKIGRNCIIAGQAGLVGHIEIADKMIIGAQAGVSKSFEQEGLVIRGSPALPIREQMKQEAMMRNLGEMMQRIKQLESELAALKNNQASPQS
ncbi:MAG: UDP-3-O-(3-hydroxymyristoyl)glucosamine N-acyltransferase [Chlorobiales bacterium]|nr:UDP-3-O-(3-hydroxymyristoyl)glucosamine N-acyltransferase [Chlorobiales bacterium]